jgi:hypothetical protein
MDVVKKQKTKKRKKKNPDIGKFTSGDKMHEMNKQNG